MGILNILNMIITNIYIMLLITTGLFTVGSLGLLFNRKNILIIIMSIELMLLAVNLFIIFSVYLDDILGQLFVIFILTVAATESSIGLAILAVYYKVINSIVIGKIKTTKG